MRRRLAIFFLVTAWLCASGVLWDMVQVVAWGRMFAGYAREANVATALRETFDPRRPCPICRAVSQARDTAQRQLPQDQNSNPALQKMVFLPEAESGPIVLAVVSDRAEMTPARALTRPVEVPVPPPRA